MPSDEDAYVLQETDEFNVIFIHRSLDDAGLTANQFRLVAHLSRRAHSTGKAWPGIDAMAQTCRMHKETVVSSIRELESLRMIRVERTPGKKSIYRLTRPSEWLLPVGNGERSANQSEMGNAPVGNGERHQSEKGNVRSTKKDNKEGDTSRSRGTLAEIEAFCTELGIPDASYFFNHWESCGWKNAGKPIKCWRSTIRAWQAAGHLPSQKNQRHGKTHPPTRSASPANAGTHNAGSAHQYA